MNNPTNEAIDDFKSIFNQEPKMILSIDLIIKPKDIEYTRQNNLNRIQNDLEPNTYFRINPSIEIDIPLDETETKILSKMAQDGFRDVETKVFQVVQILKNQEKSNNNSNNHQQKKINFNEFKKFDTQIANHKYKIYFLRIIEVVLILCYLIILLI